MKNVFLLLVGVLLLAACSTPKKYSYHFDHYNYNIGKKKTSAPRTSLADNREEITDNSMRVEDSPIQVTSEDLVASVEKTAPLPVKSAPTAEKNAVAKKYSAMSKSEKKEFRKSLIKEIKNLKKIKKGDNNTSPNNTKVMDYNLKMAIIFGAVALTLSFFGGVNSIFWVLSVVSLVIGVVFFIKWIAEQ
jgi:hypothetical protein